MVEKESEEQAESTASLQERKEFIKTIVAGYALGELHLSYSSLSKFRRSPLTFINYKMKPKETTEDMLRGKIVDCLVLTPWLFKDKYITDEDIYNELVAEGSKSPRSTNKYKEWKAAQTGNIVSADIMNQAKAMAEAVNNDPVARKILDACKDRQRKVEFEHKGLKFIGYLDADGDYIVDLKCMQDAEPRKVQRTIVDRDYWLQAGVYTMGLEVKPYYVIAVDKSCNVSVVLIEEEFVSWSCDKIDRLCDEFNDCLYNPDLFSLSFSYRSPTNEGYFVMQRPPYLS